MVEIAPGQREHLDFLNDSLDRLGKTVEKSSATGFRDLKGRLDQWAAKVAVIGQVKAGKSTFLNAFLNQLDFLPSDINPWTSVVTNIRINVPVDPASGARFSFFSENDWDEIISGTSRIRKLTEELLPGFDGELLKKQSQEMRDRAQKRLGKHYHALLGKEHSYDFLTADLLKRYVCAGPGADAGLERESLGRYAALTKVADAYVRLPEFKVPTIITDTPGVNDPFLVRDEFTCRSLDKSDVFIVVLSAHQPLTDVDIALIRILAKQDNKDCLIFVNRIDELDDFSTQVPKVIDDVTRRLTDAIPDIDFKIIAGSALLADFALRDGEDAAVNRDAADTEELRDYLQGAYGEVPEDQRDRLYLASGLDRLKQTLSTAIDNGIGCRQLNQLVEDIRAEVNGVQFVTRRERDSLQAQVEKAGGRAEEVIAELEAEIASVRGIQDDLEQHFETADGQIEQVLTNAWSVLERQLMGELDSYISEQRAYFEDRLFRDKVNGGSASSFQIDVTPLQLRLEKAVRENFGASRISIDSALESCIGACRMAIHNKFDAPTENISLDGLPFDYFTSTLTLPRQTLQMEAIADRKWAFWKRSTVNIDKSIEALRTIAVAELRPGIEKLLTAFNEAQVERASAGSSRIRVMLRMIDSGLAERTQRLRSSKVELEQITSNPEMRDKMVRRLQSRMEVLERRLLNLAATDSALSRSELDAAA